MPRLVTRLLLLLPGATVVYLAFNAGGFFPGTPAFAAIVLLQVLILRVLLADAPFAGMSRALTVVAGCLAAYAAWSLLSATWSDATWRALVEFDRVLLYLVVVVLFGSIGSSEGRLRWLIWGLAAALTFVCLAGLVTRILPEAWPTDPNVENERLAYPIGYWNGFGLMAGMGLVLCFHLAGRARGSALPRVLGAAAVPGLATALFFTFSRGAIIATIAGLVAYAALARPRGLVAALLATAPVTAIALVSGYGADQLATPFPDAPEGVAEGKDVALVLALCMAGAAALRGAGVLLDRRLAAPEVLVRPRTARLATGGGALVALVVFLALGGPGWVGEQYDNFVHGGGIQKADLRERLTDVSNNGRLEHWEVSRHSLADAPLRGSGAGTYQVEWDQDRDLNLAVIDAHGLYFEVAGELGLVGLLLLLAAVATILGGLLWRVRGGLRVEYAALFAIALAWTVHAGVDWDWELPAVTLPFFAAGAAGLGARKRTDAAPGKTDVPWRIPVAVGLVLAAATPALIAMSQGQLSDAAESFAAGDCRAAVPEALDAASLMAARPEPYEIVGYCHVQQGFAQQGVRAMEKAVDRDPENWEYRYGLAVARAAAGLDPRPDARAALARNPRETIVRDLAEEVTAGARSQWPDAAEKARIAMYESGLLSLP